MDLVSFFQNKASFPKDSEVPDLAERDGEEEEEEDDLDYEEEEEELAKEDPGNDKDQKSWDGRSKKMWGGTSDRKLVQSLRLEGEELISLVAKGGTTVLSSVTKL